MTEDTHRRLVSGESLRVAELRVLARNLRVKGGSRLRKPELRARLKRHLQQKHTVPVRPADGAPAAEADRSTHAEKAAADPAEETKEGADNPLLKIWRYTPPATRNPQRAYRYRMSDAELRATVTEAGAPQTALGDRNAMSYWISGDGCVARWACVVTRWVQSKRLRGPRGGPVRGDVVLEGGSWGDDGRISPLVYTGRCFAPWIVAEVNGFESHSLPPDFTVPLDFPVDYWTGLADGGGPDESEFLWPDPRVFTDRGFTVRRAPCEVVKSIGRYAPGIVALVTWPTPKDGTAPWRIAVLSGDSVHAMPRSEVVANLRMREPPYGMVWPVSGHTRLLAMASRRLLDHGPNPP
jgi:hypothetical protein